MASAWGEMVWPADGHGHFQVGVSADLAYMDDSSCTYTVGCHYQTWWGYQVHSTWRVWADDGASPGNYMDHSEAYELAIVYGQYRLVGTRQVTFERRDADYTAWAGASFQQHGGYGDGFGQALCSFTVPARPKYPPNPPTISSAGRAADGSVVLSVSAAGATQLEIARQASGSDAWAQVYSGAPASSWSDRPGAGTYRYRARAGNADGWSQWSAETAWVVAQCAPAAPSLTAPQSGATIDAASQSVRMAWLHNPKDGSAQTKAEVRWSLDGGGRWETAQVSGDAREREASFAAGSSVVWDVRTAGASGEWGPRSAQGRFYVFAAPKVSVSVAEVTALPFEISWTVQDGAGSQASADMSVLDASGAAVWSGSVSGASGSVEVPASGLAPRDGQTYEAVVRVRSTTGLYGTGRASFGVDYSPPAAPAATAEATPAGGVLVTVEALEGDVDTVSMSVWRGEVCVASGLMTGQSCTDPVPPLDEPLGYRVVAHAASGAVAETAIAAEVPSGGFAYFNYGPAWERVARMAMNMRAGERVSPEVETIQTPGRDLPVTAYGRHVTVEGTVEADVWWLEDISQAGAEAMLDAFRGLSAWAGDVAMRLPRGERRRVSVQVQADRGDVYGVSSVAVDWTEVDGGLD